uniref:MFS domain-containing protein n=1 Tax=Haemonchus contortus TaxID=6289 RepID=A0A7I4Y7S6_HAECO
MENKPEQRQLLELDKNGKALPPAIREDPEATNSSVKETQKCKTPWASIYLAGACAFVQAVQFGIFTSSMWPYLRKLNPQAIETEFGYILGLYSFAQCISAPLFGYWSNRIEQVRLPLLAGFAFMMAGNSLYLFLETVPSSNVVHAMMLARVVAGCGTGNMSLLRAYVSMSSSRSDRSRAIACVSGGIAIGTLVGPAFQLLFTPLGPDGIRILPFLSLSIYSAPALFSLVLNVAGMMVILFVFKEDYTVMHAAASAKGNAELPSPCMIAVLVCVATRFVQIFGSATIGTLGSAFSMLMFSFNKEEAVLASAASHLAAGVVGVILYFVFIFYDLTKCVPPRRATILVLTTYICLYLFTLPWPFLPNKVEISVNGSDAGCFADRFSWCDNLTQVSPYVYYTMFVLVFGFGVSIMNIAITTLYSEVIGPRRQGTLQGLFQMSGSVGRMLAPLITSFLYTAFGPQAPWLVDIAVISAIIACWIIFRKKMVPLESRIVPKTPSPKEDC